MSELIEELRIAVREATDELTRLRVIEAAAREVATSATWGNYTHQMFVDSGPIDELRKALALSGGEGK